MAAAEVGTVGAGGWFLDVGQGVLDCWWGGVGMGLQRSMVVGEGICGAD